MSNRIGKITLFAGATIVTLLLFLSILLFGQVTIPIPEVSTILTGGEVSNPAWYTIVVESRLPMAITALLAGSALAVSGLLLQTAFRNPLAGPSVLGISSGASLGVALTILALSEWGVGGWIQSLGTFIGAVTGAAAIIALLTIFSFTLRNNLSLLIVGIMISYLSSALISILNTFAPAEAIRSFVIWGLGSYSGVTLNELPAFAILVIAICSLSACMQKPLNAMLLGDRYLRTMGYNVTAVNASVMIMAGVLAAVVTAWCGPIGFIGLIVPHIARMIFNTSNHATLIPATLLTGAAVSLLCTLLSVIPITSGVLPINTVTPIIGVPMIIYIMLNTKRLKYFN